jgi:hypothetical protein
MDVDPGLLLLLRQFLGRLPAEFLALLIIAGAAVKFLTDAIKRRFGLSGNVIQTVSGGLAALAVLLLCLLSRFVPRSVEDGLALAAVWIALWGGGTLLKELTTNRNETRRADVREVAERVGEAAEKSTLQEIDRRLGQ